MLQINDITYRIGDRVLLQGATAGVPEGKHVGVVGRNGVGKSTLFSLIRNEIPSETGSISVPKNWRIGGVEQEAPATDISLLETVLAADTERLALLTEAETATDPHRIADIHTRLADIDAHSAPARAASILAGLGFDEADQARPTKDFSGGWRMRVALAALLFTQPDLLLLDEPTNYLDLEGTIWLVDFLRKYPRTLLIVSHDRDLLDQVATGILHLEHQRLSFYSGNFARFQKLKAEQAEHDIALRKKLDAKRKHMSAFVERFRAKASKARQAQSRMKALSKLELPTVLADEQSAPISLQGPEDLLPPPIITMEDASVGYDEKAILSRMTLRIDQDDRIALLGANGNGKSTFAKLITARLKQMDGKVRRSPKLRIGYFAQHQVDELPEGLTPYQTMRQRMEKFGEVTDAQVRTRVGAIGFSGKRADVKVRDLSGGEKARLLLALATFDKPHMLVLDEPTNHLDMQGRDQLVDAINNYPGAVILISHDQHLIDSCADRLWLVHGGRVEAFDGDMDDYRRLLLSQRGRPGAQSDDRPAVKASAPDRAPAPTAEDEARGKAARKEAAKARASIAPLKKKADAAEMKIIEIEEKITKLDAVLADGSLFERDPAKADLIARARGELGTQLEKAEAAWEACHVAYEDAVEKAGLAAEDA
ncbi:ATP-binding cassette domain-containing protein [Pyruvatibacter mobilis]|uniref:ATP-binding cassette domain-containing protein n=1 Tax=Pyruvatibacter mobilis TaxID=1712261 RepID=A0A845QA64_9HYPH|nr:ABC-F family ATP-binding cassette domain-containing protein [Pyruvatibacter mobilis]NBG95535.1 ATP-binding cassette domain-containing protein [Pyruvatibacter mobilis]QJD75387.1 ABC-F family ATP-binding cassette domain-containing protein [Pyruvatibacter mobilis]GGD15126.1 glycosyl transferase family 1 [Pyruvatibacter mobilis]